MSLRFSLLSLIGLVSWAALACAALVQPGPGWLSVVVSLTAAAVTWQLLRAIFADSASRAAAAGWLLFAIAYLAVAQGPWLGQTIGPRLASTQALNYAQVNWRKEDPNHGAAVYQTMQSLNAWGQINGRINTLAIDGIALYVTPPPTQPQFAPLNSFQLSGHWLFAWLIGWLGASVAGHCYRQREGGRESLAGEVIPIGKSLPAKDSRPLRRESATQLC
jgi:hypothetical protein